MEKERKLSMESLGSVMGGMAAPAYLSHLAKLHESGKLDEFNREFESKGGVIKEQRGEATFYTQSYIDAVMKS